MALSHVVEPVTAHDLEQIARDIWSTFTGLELEPAPDPGGPLAAETMTGCVHLSGLWDGTVLVEASRQHAATAAEAMFAAAAGSLGEDDIGDAFGELSNMVAGNVKGALPVHTQLSMPAVTSGGSYTVRVPGAQLLETVLLQSPAGPLRITVWRTARWDL